MVRFKNFILIFSLAWGNCESRYENRKFEEIISAINNLQANLYLTNQKIDQLQNDVENISTSNSQMMTTVLTKIDEAKGEVLQKVNEIYSMTKIIKNDTHEMDSSYLDEVQTDNDTFEEAEDQVILVTGGASEKAIISVEVLNNDGTPLCMLSDLPNERLLHTMNNDMLCGGGNELPMASCLQYTDGGWKEYTSYTHKKKIYHVSWLRPDGGVQLIGGWVAGRQEEHDPTVIVKGSSSKPGFKTKHHTENACAIQLDEYVVITGGQQSRVNLHGASFVTKYDTNGWIEDLPELNTGRLGHGCAHFYNNLNELVYLVAGGLSDLSGLEADELLASTEIMVEGSSYWTTPLNLPNAIEGLVGISVNNQVFMIGGIQRLAEEPQSQILKYDTDQNDWLEVGKMNIPRNYHAATLMPRAKIEQYCIV